MTTPAQHTPNFGACPICRAEPVRIHGFKSYAPEFAYEGGGFDPADFADLARTEAGNFWFRARNRLIIWALRKYAPRLKSFLEVGCGTGFVLSAVSEEFPQAALSGSEIFVDGLRIAAERVPGAQFVQMDARHMPFAAAFDAIGAFDVLEHIREDEQALAELHRALKPGGTLVISVPQHRWLWSPADVAARHERRYSAGELRHKVSAAGFEIVRTTSFVTLLLPLMAIWRWRQRQIGHYDAESEFSVNPALNWMLERLLTVERWGIQLGLNYPWGGSRLLIARKPDDVSPA